tara:strand:- start:154 stop:300 length:147 start_codon:yes stop_codon:yes gene_type:complete
MAEFLQLLEASLVGTAVILAAVTVPVAVVTDTPMPDLKPLIEIMEDES